MKCDDFLPWLETGGMWRRWLAGRHAARCSRCAAVRDTWIEAKRQLIAPEPLTADLRRMWKQAAGETARLPHVLRRWFSMPAAVAAACVLVFAVAVIAWKVTRWRPVEPDKGGETIEANVPPIQLVDRSGEFASLAASVRQLQAELDETLLDAERLEARRQAAELLDRYGKW